MLFRKKKVISGIFDDLPVIQGHPSTQRVEQKKHGRRAMLVPTSAADPNVSADQLLTNTGKPREEWFDIIFDSPKREAKQKDISLWLQESFRVQKWWANSIALAYLDWRKANKTTSAQESVLRLVLTVPTTLPLAFSIFKSEKLYGDSFRRFLKQVANEKLAIAFSDGTRATVSFRNLDEQCELLVEHEFIGNPAMLKMRNRFWVELVDGVAQQVSR